MSSFPGFNGSENPYQAPRLPVGAPSAPASSLLAYRPADQLVAVLTILLSLNLLIGAIGAVSSWMQYDLLQGVAAGRPLDDEQSEANDTRQMLIGGGQLLLYLVTAVVFAIWIHRANSNARALGARGMEFTPGWSVGWFFIPIANWFKPFQAMREIWRASSPTLGEDDWRYGPSAPVLGVWWALWLIASILGQLSFRLSWHAKDLSSLMTASVAQILSEVVDVPLTIAAILLVRGIQARQVEKSRVGLDPTVPTFGGETWPRG